MKEAFIQERGDVQQRASGLAGRRLLALAVAVLSSGLAVSPRE